jgi:hypothetical protein
MDTAAARFHGSRPLEAGQAADEHAKRHCPLSEEDKVSIEIISRELAAECKEGRQSESSRDASGTSALLANATTLREVQDMRRRGLLTAPEIAKDRKHRRWKCGLIPVQGRNPKLEDMPAGPRGEGESSTDEEMQRLGHIADNEAACQEGQERLGRRDDPAKVTAGAHKAYDKHEAEKSDARNTGTPDHGPSEVAENSDTSFDYPDGWHEEGPTFFPPGPVCKYCARHEEHGDCKYSGSSSEEGGHKTVGLRESLWLSSSHRAGPHPEVKFCCKDCQLSLRTDKAPPPRSPEAETDAPATQDLQDFGDSSSDPEAEVTTGETMRKPGTKTGGVRTTRALGAGHAGLGRSGFKLQAGPIPPPSSRHILIDISSASEEESQTTPPPNEGLPPPGASSSSGIMPELDNDRTRRAHLALTGGAVMGRTGWNPLTPGDGTSPI